MKGKYLDCILLGKRIGLLGKLNLLCVDSWTVYCAMYEGNVNALYFFTNLLAFRSKIIKHVLLLKFTIK